MQNTDLSDKKILLLNLSDEIQNFNNFLLSTNWDDVNFDLTDFKNGLCLESNLFSFSQEEFLKLLLRLVPEWRRTLGCKQHETHSYCLDIHILSVIKKIIIQDKFKSLDDYYKLIILWGALLHDIEKKENIIDPEHPFNGAEKAKLILQRLQFDNYFIKSVYSLVRYHQIIGFIAIDRLKLDISDLTAKIGCEKIAELFIIFSIADIKAVKSNEAFYNDYIDKNIKYIHSEINKYYRKIAD
ncbi:MAG: HD domain-containing protein [Candidatus Gastranaerophilales bacterium]|nr:HD domain-containing protein [Candidatus Gastranaerophilales bacterium]